MAYEVAPSIHPGDPIPPPSGEVVLTVSGNLGVTNVGDTLQLDMPTLERLGLVKYSIIDPYQQVDTAFTEPRRSRVGFKCLGLSNSANMENSECAQNSYGYFVLWD